MAWIAWKPGGSDRAGRAGRAQGRRRHHILRVRLHEPAALATAEPLLSALAAAGTTVASNRPANELAVRVSRPDAAAEALRRLGGQGLRVATIQLTQPSLDDVFLSLTGRTATVSAPAEES